MKNLIFAGLVGLVAMVGCSKGDGNVTPTVTYKTFIDSFHIQYDKPYVVEGVSNDTVYFSAINGMTEVHGTARATSQLTFTWRGGYDYIHVHADNYSIQTPILNACADTADISQKDPIEFSSKGKGYYLHPAF